MRKFEGKIDAKHETSGKVVRETEKSDGVEVWRWRVRGWRSDAGEVKL